MTLKHRIYLLVVVDYHTRIIKARLMTKKEANIVAQKAKEIFDNLGCLKKLITDEGAEFMANQFKQLCYSKGIYYHKSSPDKYQSNGRVERGVKKIWQILRKEKADVEMIN